MTTRMLFERQKRRIMGVGLFGFALGTAGTVLAQWNLLPIAPHLAALPGGGLFLLALLYANLFAFRCPRCGGPCDGLVMTWARSLFGIDGRFRYCPFCGSNIDTELDARHEAG